MPRYMTREMQPPDDPEQWLENGVRTPESNEHMALERQPIIGWTFGFCGDGDGGGMTAQSES